VTPATYTFGGPGGQMDSISTYRSSTVDGSFNSNSPDGTVADKTMYNYSADNPGQVDTTVERRTMRLKWTRWRGPSASTVREGWRA
jgi:hypothetical protein